MRICQSGGYLLLLSICLPEAAQLTHSQTYISFFLINSNQVPVQFLILILNPKTHSKFETIFENDPHIR